MSATEGSLRRRLDLEGLGRYGAVLVLLVSLFAFLSITQPRFLTGANIENLLTGVSILWIVSLGMTFVVLTGGIDLSVGSVLALVGIFLAKVLDLGVPGGVAVVLCLGFGALVGGLVNGVLIGRLGLSFFVVTLGSMVALSGVVNLWSQTRTTYIDSAVVARIGVGHLLGLPVPIWLMLATFAVALYVQRSTYFGRDVYAVGGNLDAARLSGIRTARTVVAVYAISAACAALGGVIQAGRIGAASPQVGANVALDAAAAVLLGGTSFVGGLGGVGGTAVGVLFIGVLQNGLGIAGVASFWQQVVTGVILIAAVLIDRIRRHALAGRVRSPAPGAP
jgi:ribose/xylose/arabinose/galactoside ABC-type transport system permease subunit